MTAIAATSETLDRVIYGIGTVSPLQSVTVRSRIDGQVLEVPFSEGQIVEKGAVLLRLDDSQLRSDLTSAKAKRAQDEAQLKGAQTDADRYETLTQSGVAAMATLEQKRSTSQQLAAAVDYDNAMIKNAETQLSFATITAPFTGRAGFRQADPGSIVSASSTTGIVTITQMDPIGVSFVAPGDRFGDIRDAMRKGIATVEVSTTDGTSKLGTGQLKIMDNAVDAETGSIHLRADFDNSAEKLWPGLPVATRLTVERRQGVVVPDKALARSPAGLYAYVVGKDGKVQKRDVTTAFVTDARALVTKGIAEGDQVVMDGQSRIGDGVKVSVTPWNGMPDGQILPGVSQ
ncbi:efflux RND transporter periplasmic adaptor subunit [Allorhizobium taibaishanense]|uniref:Multidrug efflux system membrane fusion protein n=1 Tax=Allorhizobium taibaishanense TaxID=887144 RepID=A0A7W6MUS8_9HYPH|nr:efflux RND transporter periplasmic adaptor subunit [Allorhizobium taibaishanense]MBB4008434.1 multidrug efflux system membrane fusion protein [Allorhizobium taibaishanense]